jgi:aspartate racemase
MSDSGNHREGETVLEPGPRDFGNVEARPTLVLVGGLGPAATIFYYREILKAHASIGLVPKLQIVHAHLPIVLEALAAGDRIGLADYLAGLINSMSHGAGQIAAIAAIAPHLCIAELAGRSRIPLVDSIEEVAAAVHARDLRRVALFGTRYAMETRLFGRLRGTEIVEPSPADTERIHRSYLEIAESDAVDPRAVEALRTIARDLVENRGAQAIILAGTDLSPVFDEETAGFPLLDCSRIHVEAIVRRLARP